MIRTSTSQLPNKIQHEILNFPSRFDWQLHNEFAKFLAKFWNLKWTSETICQKFCETHCEINGINKILVVWLVWLILHWNKVKLRNVFACWIIFLPEPFFTKSYEKNTKIRTQNISCSTVYRVYVKKKHHIYKTMAVILPLQEPIAIDFSWAMIISMFLSDKVHNVTVVYFLWKLFSILPFSERREVKIYHHTLNHCLHFVTGCKLMIN